MNNDKDDISTNVKNKFALLLTEERLQKRNNLKRWVVVGDGLTSHFLNISFFIFEVFPECSIWSSGDTSDVMCDDHIAEYPMTSEHHGDITIQTEAKCNCYQIWLNLKLFFSTTIFKGLVQVLSQLQILKRKDLEGSRRNT